MNIEQKLNDILNYSNENEVIEFKEAKQNYDFKKLGKYFSALSNEANLKRVKQAWLIFGVNDRRQIVGTSYRDKPKDLESLKKEVADKTTNRLSFIDIHELYIDKYRVLMFEIPASPTGLPVAWDGHYFGRDGESLGALNIEEIERIRTQNQIYDWSAQICIGASIEDLDRDAIELAKAEFAKKNPKLKEDVDSWNDVTFLNKAKLTIQGKITRTTILLLGNTESSHWLNPATPTITWILKDRDGLERDYQHFSCPLLINAEAVFKKVRNLKYRYMDDSSLFPEEVDQYDPYLIREALNNAIAHQDYEVGGKINVVEFEDGRLSFSNLGRFIPGSIENVIHSDSPEPVYRNRFLAEAMVNLNMIDTIGSGIRKMFIIQKNKFFPLPEYDLNNDRVQLTLTGRVLDMNYAHKLAEMPELKLDEIVLLDRVQKNKSLSNEQVKHLKQQGLIEGRKPNYFISARVASFSGDKAGYILTRGLHDQHYKNLICEYIEQFGSAKRVDINKLLLDKLPDVLDQTQKQNKIKNLLQAMKKEGLIEPEGKSWKMSKK